MKDKKTEISWTAPKDKIYIWENSAFIGGRLNGCDTEQLQKPNFLMNTVHSSTAASGQLLSQQDARIMTHRVKCCG